MRYMPVNNHMEGFVVIFRRYSSFLATASRDENHILAASDFRRTSSKYFSGLDLYISAC
jgi:hypothetical protein